MGVAAADDATSVDRGLDSLFEKHSGRVEVVLARLAKNGHAVGEGTAYDAIWALRFCLSNESDDDAVTNAEETLVCVWGNGGVVFLEPFCLRLGGISALAFPPCQELFRITGK